MPNNCTTRYFSNYVLSTCTSGNGSYRAVAECRNIWGRYWSYGPWKRVGQGTSMTDCGFGWLRGYSTGLSSR